MDHNLANLYLISHFAKIMHNKTLHAVEMIYSAIAFQRSKRPNKYIARGK